MAGLSIHNRKLITAVLRQKQPLFLNTLPVTARFVDVSYLSCVLLTFAIDNYKIQATIVVVVVFFFVFFFVLFFFWSKGHVIFTAGIAFITVISGCDIQTTLVGNSVLYRMVLTH